MSTFEKEEIKRVKPLIARSRGFFGFKQLNTSYHAANLQASDFEAILEDQEKWTALSKQMDAYFSDRITILPHEQDVRPAEAIGSDAKKAPASKSSSSSYFGSVVSAIRGLARPQRFFQIQRDMIQRRFPGGHGREPGDADLRDVIIALRHVFAHNMIKLIALKRFVTIVAVLAMIGVCYAAYAHNVELSGFVHLNVVGSALPEDQKYERWTSVVAIAACAACVLLIAVIFYFFNKLLSDYYVSSLNESCLTANTQISIRTKQLANLVDEISQKIDKDRAVLDNEQRLAEWPDRARRLMYLVYWLASRLEYVERFVQVEIWRMRRIHYWQNRFGRYVAYALLLGTVALAAATSPLPWQETSNEIPVDMDIVRPVATALWGAGAIAALILAVASFTAWRTPFNLLQNTLQPGNWFHYADLKLQEKIASQVFRDKQTILRNEEMLAGQKR